MLLYRLLMTLLASRELMTRAIAGDKDALRARLGLAPAPEKQDRIWLHAASNGELASARPVIDRLTTQGHNLLITVNTDSALALAQGWALPNTLVLLAPVDLPGPTRRVIRNWDITAHITLESDLWPQRILDTPGPVLVLGGRLTERSAKGWQRFRPMVARVMGKLGFLSAQDPDSARRFAQFGLPKGAQGPVFDLKALYTPPTDSPSDDLQAAFARADTWLAASTHEGEDAIVLQAHLQTLKQRPDLRLILAPRHPKRADAVAAMIVEHGLSVARRSTGDDPNGTQVYLADTFGEMHLWYALAGVTFVAGSLTDRGGHTPYEPAAFGSAILHGPDTANFRAAYQRLEHANAARMCPDADSISAALMQLKTAQDQVAMGQAAKQALRQEADFDQLMHDITKTLNA